ncbi:MAG TPA: hypothetical protein VGJ20_06910 [Xanthobacteraceae bacterium]|jgi:hypothetical protein
MTKFIFAFAALLSVGVAPAFAQQPDDQAPPAPSPGTPSDRPTTHAVVTITTAKVFQQVLPPASNLEGLTIENNNKNGNNCWLFIGSGSATIATSTLLTQGASYIQYWPFVPSGAILATCDSSGDTLSIEMQQMTHGSG